MASTKLSVSTSSSGTRTKWTISFWVKRSNLSNENCVVGSHLDGNNKDKIAFHTDGKLSWGSFQAGSYTNMGNLITTRVFRDVNAWYHIVCRWDTGNSTANDRMKIWVNGVEETSFSTRINPELNRVSLINYQNYTALGNNGASGNYFDGSLSHVHFCDNYAYSASDFGSFDTDTGEWKINATPSVSYGTNGFFVLKDGNSLTDQSPNTNNLTLSSGTLTKTEDCPSNVFATWNSLNNYYSQSTFANGNTKATMGSSQYTYNTSTLGMTSGKWYAEFKQGSGGSDSMYGISSTQATSTSAELGNYPNDYGYYQADGKIWSNNSYVVNPYGATWSAGDIIGVAVDLDNNKLYFSKNGTWQNSGDPTSGSTGTGAVSITAPASTSLGAYFFGFSDYWGAGSSSTEANFGNGYFGTTAVSSAGTNASSNGIFEYDVPTGYTALSTKGLNL